MSMFQKATKRAVRARIGIDGPSGAGKTYTALTWAQQLGNKIAVVDTERGSASLYSDLFDFDVLEVSPPYHPDRFTEAIKEAEKAGYDVLVIDSLSHVWDGEGGVLDIVDAAASRQNGNSYTAWKSGTPVLRHLVDTILGCDMHVIVTMRSKTEYVLEENERGKKTPRKVGMAPVMRAGMEYELTLVGDLDLEHRMTISKSRCPALSDVVIQPGRAAEAADTFVAWTRSGAGVASRGEIDALKQALNDIEPKDRRVQAKQAFAAEFGNPDYLLADRLPAAREFVARAGDAQVSPESSTGGADPTSGSDHDGAPGADVTDPPRATTTTVPGGERPITPKAASALHAAAHRKPDSDAGEERAVDDLVFRVLVYAESGGRTDSAAHLSAREADAVRARVEHWRRGETPKEWEQIADRYLNWVDSNANQQAQQPLEAVGS